MQRNRLQTRVQALYVVALPRDQLRCNNESTKDRKWESAEVGANGRSPLWDESEIFIILLRACDYGYRISHTVFCTVIDRQFNRVASVLVRRE